VWGQRKVWSSSIGATNAVSGNVSASVFTVVDKVISY
jgi:hypothetical protein